MSTRIAFAAALAFAVWLHAPSAALANGAFPDSLGLIFPAGRPQQIVLATNFGLIISDDGGATWSWTCEQARTTSGGLLYGVTAAPRNRFLAVSVLGLAYSDDDSCSWQLAGGALAQATPRDYFPDPTDADRVLAIAWTSTGSDQIFNVFPSSDGGATFGAPLYTAPAGATLNGVESARSDPRTIYLTMYTETSGSGTATVFHPLLVRSRDGGTSWTVIDVEPMLGTVRLRIMGVDPTDAATLYLRVIAPASEGIAVTKDGGATVAAPVSVPDGVMTAFARLSSGTVLVGAIAGENGLGFRSTDGGLTFQDWSGVPHLRALAEHDGKIYAAGNNFSDSWAIGVSTDQGMTFRPFASYSDVTAIKACVRLECADACDRVGGYTPLWDPAVCPGNQPEGGTEAPRRPPPKGCGCQLGGARGGLPAASLFAVLLALALSRRRP